MSKMNKAFCLFTTNENCPNKEQTISVKLQNYQIVSLDASKLISKPGKQTSIFLWNISDFH